MSAVIQASLCTTNLNAVVGKASLLARWIKSVWI